MHFQWTHLHESESPPFRSSDVHTLSERLPSNSCCYRMRLGLCWLCRFSLIHSWTVFHVAVENFQEESLCVPPRSRACVGVKTERKQSVSTTSQSFAF